MTKLLVHNCYRTPRKCPHCSYNAWQDQAEKQCPRCKKDWDVKPVEDLYEDVYINGRLVRRLKK